MGTGNCKYCRKHSTDISQYDRYPDNTLIRNKKWEAIGICLDCELQIPSTKKELLEAATILKESMHMSIVVRELLQILPDEGAFNLKDVYTVIKDKTAEVLKKHNYPISDNNYESLEDRVGYIIVAAARMKQEDTPKGRKQAAKSIFLRGQIDMIQSRLMSGDLSRLEKEFGKWYNNV
jgi:hypothetical protein